MTRNHHNQAPPIGHQVYHGEDEDNLYEQIDLDNSLLTGKVRELRWKLNQKAKKEPKFKFYSLYGLLCRKDIIESAWKHVAKRGKAAGIDGLKAEHILVSAEETEKFLNETADLLQNKRYTPSPVLRVYIPKADGSKRPLGIPTLRDRLVQMATKLILEPIFEADFLDCSYGFRPGKNAHDALQAIKQHVKEGRPEVYDADLKGYFDSIPHDKLLKCVGMRVADSSVIKLIKSWLRAPVVEVSQDNKRLPPRANRKGTPQGGVISPLLANLYLHWFDKKFHRKSGPFNWANAKLVRYADDFVIMAKYVGKRLESWITKEIEEWLGLTINDDKTSVKRLKDGASLDFLGFTFRYDRGILGYKGKFLNLVPSKKAVKKARAVIRARTDCKYCFKPATDIVRELNMFIRGWSNYFKQGYYKSAFSSVGCYARQRMITHLNRRSQRKYRRSGDTTDYAHLKKMGLICL